MGQAEVKGRHLLVKELSALGAVARVAMPRSRQRFLKWRMPWMLATTRLLLISCSKHEWILISVLPS